jgi:ribosomal protein S18 acetylase RimI-like enzyme
MARIRPYRESDLDDVVDVFRSNIPKYFGPEEEPGLVDFLQDDLEDYYVVETNGEIVGAGGIAKNNDDTVSLCWGMIRSDHLGTGLGKALTRFRIERARGRFGPLPLVISTSHHTEGFYKKLGFETTERIPNGFGPGIDICKMRKEN